MQSTEVSSGPSGARLRMLLFRAFRGIERIDLQSIRRLGFGCITDFALLEVLLHQGPLPARAIGERVLLTSGSVTTAIDRAESDGLVTRQQDDRDRRSVRVSLTDKGRQRIETAYEQHKPALDGGFDRLSEDERSELARLLVKVARNSE